MTAVLVAAAASVLVVAAAWVFGATVVAADPSTAPLASPPPLLASGDLRSEGSGPGLVGNPLLILAGVVLLGLGTALVTVLLVRLARRD
jgi:hypothetical protein